MNTDPFYILKKDDIIEIGIDHLDRLFIIPAHQHFEYIYRSAAEVGWDDKGNFLFSPKPREWSYFDWYKHIVTIVKTEYGCTLLIKPQTLFSNISDELKEQILNFIID
ncbi:MAG: hypothetical protein ABI761_12625 [Saprospiraceae bacterium]